MIPVQGAQVPFLVGELRSHMLCSPVKKKKKKKRELYLKLNFKKDLASFLIESKSINLKEKKISKSP